MKTESQEPTVTYNPHVYVSADSEEHGAEALYANAGDFNVDKTPATSDKRTFSIPSLPSIPPFFPLVAVCWGILVVIMVLRIHFTAVISAKLSNQMKDSEEADRYFTYVTNNFTLTSENLERDHSNLKAKIEEMTQARAVLESNITQLSEENQKMKENIEQLRAENQTVHVENEQVKAQNENLTAENQQLKTQNENLTAENQQLKTQNENLTAENQQLKTQNENLTAENQQLKTQNENLTAENRQLRAENYWLKEGQQITTHIPCVTAETVFNHSRRRRQSRIEETHSPGERNEMSPVWSYFRRVTASLPERQREPCQTSWLHFQSSCYMISNRDPPDHRTWEEARDDCRGKNADLVVIESPEEQGFIFNNSLASLGNDGYWIGLRVEGSSWKWVKGSHLTEDYWIHRPADDHHCVISSKEPNGWKAVSCDVKKGWICEKNALSV